MIDNYFRSAGILGVALAGSIAAGPVAAISLSLVDAADIASSNITVGVGDTFSIFVRATDMPLTNSGGVNVDWTDGILQLDSWTVFAPFDEISLGAPTTTSNSISNLTGGIFIVNDPVAGDFNFAQLNFTALAPSGTPLNLTAIESVLGWTDSLGNPITFDSVLGATVTVTAVPVPAAIWLLGSGLIGMVMVARGRTAARPAEDRVGLKQAA